MPTASRQAQQRWSSRGAESSDAHKLPGYKDDPVQHRLEGRAAKIARGDHNAGFADGGAGVARRLLDNGVVTERLELAAAQHVVNGP